MNSRGIIAGAVAIPVALLVGCGSASNGSIGTPGGSTDLGVSVPSSSAPADPVPSIDPNDLPSDAPVTSDPVAPVAVPTTDAPAETAAQSQAVSAAQNYLDLGSGFSQLGLIDQLVQGNQFAVADATFAVDSLNIDYNAQAVLAAKGYLALGTGFSHAGLVDQLEQGNQFTPVQAEAGTTGAGL